MVTGAEIVVGYLIAYAWRKARQVAGRADELVDDGLDACLERLHRAVTDRLGADASLARLEDSAAAAASDLASGPEVVDVSVVPERTRERVRLALLEETETDPAFATVLTDLLGQVQELERRTGHPLASMTASGQGSVAVGGDAGGIVSTGSSSINIQYR
ncbi:hypothetical protein [Kineosporia babensis]|uniref:Chromosome partitioning protein n=1 Tax=Kineosporia babensis TaxID=499548 RepID=A0A9X1NKZ3_9ACTN|nr:hypothetical protein [Kineosporia babensis]MCD5316877.1 hypothetical protein [Kineosporia babensis]